MQVTFTLTAQATYELVIPATDAVKVTAWLETKGCQFDRYFRSNSTVKFVFITIPEILICQICSKHGLIDLRVCVAIVPMPDETPVDETPVEETCPEVEVEVEVEESGIPYFFAGMYITKEIKARYRKLSKIYHPDAGGSPEVFQALHDQYLLAIEPF